MLLLIALIISLSISVKAQLVDDLGDESRLYAESKQVNQFFRRFNGEEDEKGNRYYSSDKPYRSNKLRKKFLGVLFDESNTGISHALRKEFTENVLGDPEASILDFHGGNWFAEVNVLLQMNGIDRTATLYMELEKNHLGYKWVIGKAYADWLDPYYVRDTIKI